MRPLMLLVAAMMLVGGVGRAVRADDPNQKIRRQFEIRCKVFEVGKDGKEKVLSEPTLCMLEGRAASLFSGRPVFGPNGEERRLGTTFNVLVEEGRNGKLRVDAELEISNPHSSITAKIVAIVKDGRIMELKVNKRGKRSKCRSGSKAGCAADHRFASIM